MRAEAGPVRFADKPDIPFKLLGFTDLQEKDFVYFKTAGGHWVAAAEDEAGRLFMVDEVGSENGAVVYWVNAVPGGDGMLFIESQLHHAVLLCTTRSSTPVSSRM